MKKQYKSRGGDLSNTNAQILGEFVDSQFKGRTTAQNLVKSAKAKKSPIHHLFEWDNDKAAGKHRLWQARVFLGALVVELEEGTVREYHNVYIKDQGYTYVELDQAIQSKDLWMQVVESAKRELLHWRDRYKTYSEFKPVVKAINTLERRTQHGKDKKTIRKRKSSNHSTNRSTHR